MARKNLIWERVSFVVDNRDARMSERIEHRDISSRDKDQRKESIARAAVSVFPNAGPVVLDTNAKEVFLNRGERLIRVAHYDTVPIEAPAEEKAEDLFSAVGEAA